MSWAQRIPSPAPPQPAVHRDLSVGLRGREEEEGALALSPLSPLGPAAASPTPAGARLSPTPVKARPPALRSPGL